MSVRKVFGHPGDGINGGFGALNRAKGKIEFIRVHHEAASSKETAKQLLPALMPSK